MPWIATIVAVQDTAGEFTRVIVDYTDGTNTRRTEHLISGKTDFDGVVREKLAEFDHFYTNVRSRLQIGPFVPSTVVVGRL